MVSCYVCVFPLTLVLNPRRILHGMCCDYTTYSCMTRIACVKCVPGYDIAAIIPVTLELQLVSGLCDICTRPVQRMERICNNKHEMCNECIENWTSKGVRSCPFCRAPMFEHLFETRSSSMDFDRAFTRPEAFSLDKFIV